MSRYDGLIIPRSYSEYINKTDAATLSQALQLSGVLSGAVAAGDNKAVTSNAVNVALASYDVRTVYTGNASDYTSVYDFIDKKTNGNDYLRRFGGIIDKMLPTLSSQIGKFTSQQNGFYYGVLVMGSGLNYYSFICFSYQSRGFAQFMNSKGNWTLAIIC